MLETHISLHFYLMFLGDSEGNVVTGDQEMDVPVTDQDELLIDLVKTYPFLYSKVSKEHKDKNIKMNAWGEIAGVLQITGILLNISYSTAVYN